MSVRTLLKRQPAFLLIVLSLVVWSIGLLVGGNLGNACLLLGIVGFVCGYSLMQKTARMHSRRRWDREQVR